MISVTSAVGVTNSTLLLTVGTGNLFRLMGISTLLAAAAAPTIHNPLVSPPGTGIGVFIAPPAAVLAAGTFAFQNMPPVLGPGMELKGYYEGGNGTSQVHWRVWGYEVPLGTSFTV